MTELNGYTFFDAEFVIGHRGNTVPERSGVALSFRGRPPLGAGFFTTAAEALAVRIALVARTLPILHNSKSDRIRYVLHFSENTQIEHFDEISSQSWANVISAGLENVTAITSLDTPQDYKALYILRVGLADDETCLEECSFFCDQPQLNFKAGCYEFSLCSAVKSGDFGKILISLSPSGDNFV